MAEVVVASGGLEATSSFSDFMRRCSASQCQGLLFCLILAVLLS